MLFFFNDTVAKPPGSDLNSTVLVTMQEYIQKSLRDFVWILSVVFVHTGFVGAECMYIQVCMPKYLIQNRGTR